MTDEIIVFVRIGLFIIAGRAVAGGWLPEEVAELIKDPATVEAVTGMLIGAGTLLWYWFSESRDALKKKIAEKEK